MCSADGQSTAPLFPYIGLTDRLNDLPANGSTLCSVQGRPETVY
jgi:hypothetical protein